MTPAPPQPRTKRQFRDGLAYVRRTPELSGTLVIVAVTFGLGWQWEVLLPLLTKFAFDGDAGDFGVLSAALGFGSLVGGLVMAGRPRTDDRTMLWSVVAIAVTGAVAAATPWFVLEMVVLVAVGAAGISFAACCSATLQLRADPAMRGRVMALYIIGVQGTRPIFGPLVGTLAERLGSRPAITVCSAALLSVGVPVWSRLVRGRATAEVTVSPVAPVTPVGPPAG